MLLIRKLMSHIKEGVFYRVLMFTSAIDILSAMAFILQINCAARKATVTNKIATIIISVLTQSPLYFKYIVLLFSAVDRWLAMHRITYKSNLFVAKFTLWTLLSFIGATMIAIAKDLALMDDICLDTTVRMALHSWCVSAPHQYTFCLLPYFRSS